MGQKKIKVKKSANTRASKTGFSLIEGWLEKRFLVYVIVGLGFSLAMLLFDPKLYTGGDNATYLCLAKSLLAGDGYKDIYMPEEPPHTQYPPGYPLLLAGIMLFTGDNLFLLKMFSVLLFLGSLLIFFAFLKQRGLTWFFFSGSGIDFKSRSFGALSLDFDRDSISFFYLVDRLLI